MQVPMSRRSLTVANGQCIAALRTTVIAPCFNLSKTHTLQMNIRQNFPKAGAAYALHSSSSSSVLQNTSSNLHSIGTSNSGIRSDFLKEPTTEFDNFAPRAATKAAGERLQPQRKQLWERVKKELIHYWHGTELLGREIKISFILANRLLQGNRLTRREQQQLRRTSGDLLRLVPFSVFVIVPFMEFLLPVALKLFPNMLPSTFEDALVEEEKKHKLSRTRVEMAKFLQETIEESGIPGTEHAVAVREFGDFFKDIRITGEQPSTDELLNIADLFPGGFTFDSLSRPQLMSICRYMDLNAFGTDNLLRHRIRVKMNSIKKDDKLKREIYSTA
ncbi:hypothetical protein BGX27_003562 [Mortierella sp. AM989]|nr:hypothetical protein BGX27_003562 [Mortierella sp. AM989]